MPLFEVETEGHIIITWAEDESAAENLVQDTYGTEPITRLTKRPRDTWVISKSALGITDSTNPCTVARMGPFAGIGHRPLATRIRLRILAARVSHASTVAGTANGK